MDYQSLSHSKWQCKYHVVFIPKYRKKKLYESIRTDLGEELHRLAEQKERKILEGHMIHRPTYVGARIFRHDCWA